MRGLLISVGTGVGDSPESIIHAIKLSIIKDLPLSQTGILLENA